MFKPWAATREVGWGVLAVLLVAIVVVASFVNLFFFRLDAPSLIVKATLGLIDWTLMGSACFWPLLHLPLPAHWQSFHRRRRPRAGQPTCQHCPIRPVGADNDDTGVAAGDCLAEAAPNSQSLISRTTRIEIGRLKITPELLGCRSGRWRLRLRPGSSRASGGDRRSTPHRKPCRSCRVRTG